jgi:hypothetical protein
MIFIQLCKSPILSGFAAKGQKEPGKKTALSFAYQQHLSERIGHEF